ncbi:hypothetical protein [Sphingobacterium tabacisoli]|uniref:Lipoprotein n=1 Tax=Sphingobacterium tabacisoli TaxID=2044855 RepID=A0ABW5L6Y3_9SPHI|nr:hypothetical protein [Sphingobacterium tabacisoli]
MNYRFILWILLTTALTGCKLRRDTSAVASSQRQAKSRVEDSTSWFQLIGRDSTSHYWSFSSDSSFYFHPDDGLWGQSGTLHYIEQKRSETNHINYQNTYDSIGMSQHKEESDKRSSQTRFPLMYALWLLLIPLVLVAYFYWKR